jgi:putative ABC transport system permease protein
MRWDRRKARERDLDRELRAHLELEAEEQRANALSPQEARYAAQRMLGNMTRLKEDLRDVWRLGWLDRAKQDIAYAIRTLRRAPAFTAVAIFTLALGIGATTAIFSVVDSLLLHPLPYPNGDRLVVIWEKLTRNPSGPPVFDSYRDFEIWKSGSRSFEQLAPATWATGGRIVRSGGRARNVLAMPVGLDFFSLLGVQAELGRTFQPDDLHRGCTVVLSHGFWLQAFGGQRNIAGRNLSLDEDACIVAGVMPPGFRFYPDAAAMWMLITPGSAITRDPEHANVGVFGRLRPGVSIEAVQKEVEALRAREGQSYPAGMERTAEVYPLAEQFAYLTGPTLRLSALVLFGAVCFVLLIACVNIANLLLGRCLARQKELAVRAALGSGRARLVRQLLAETLLLTLAGGLAGTLLAAGAVHYFRVLNPIEMPPGNPVAVNRAVLGFAAALTLVTAVASGLIPALRASHADPMDALKVSGRGVSMGPAAGTLTRILAAAQVTLSITLLAGAGLLIESVNRLASVPLGFRLDHALTTSVELPKWSYTKTGQRARFYREALHRVATLPGVESAAFAASLPLLHGGRFGASMLAVEGRPEPLAGAPRDVAETSITSGYFQTMRVALKAGRLFDGRDVEGSEAVAIVNEALVRKYFPKENAIGAHIRVGEQANNKAWLTIVGIAGNERDRNFFREMSWEAIPLVFRPIAQQPPSSATLVVRTAQDQMQIGAAMQKEIWALDSNVPAGEVQPMDQQLSRVLAYPRFRAIVLGTFAGLALLLAGVGLYSVLAQSTSQRVQEFGVRMALGAGRTDVLRLVIRQGMLLTGAGLALGLLLASASTRLLTSLLYGVRATDPWIWFAVSLALLLVALLAMCVPAWRAARVDPVIALRYE